MRSVKLAISISLSLKQTGPSPYLEGVNRNLDVLESIYPGATLILHHDGSVPSDVISRCGSTVEWPRSVSNQCMFWRFSSVQNTDYDAVLVRDADSVVNRREANAMTEWLESGKDFHLMHDNPGHCADVMGGMWGVRTRAIPFDFAHLVRWWIDHKAPFEYEADQWFLSRFIFPYALRSCVNHRSRHSTLANVRPFPDGPEPHTGFVGERVVV